MLSGTVLGGRLLFPVNYKVKFAVFLKNGLFSTAALKLFDEIPQRVELPVSASFSNRKPTSQLSKKSFCQGRKSIFIKDSLKHGNAHEALESFCRVIASGRKPSGSIFCIAVNSCTKAQNLRLGLQIHARVIRAGYEENLYLGSALVDMYAKHCKLADARKVFDGMRRHDEVSWTSLITGLSQSGHAREAVLLFRDMLGSNNKPNCFTYVSVISACAGLEATVEQVIILHAHVIVLGLQANSYIASSLIDCYSKYGKIDQAVLLFRATTERDNIILNSMISGYVHNEQGEEALELFVSMRKDGLNSTGHTVTSILNACGSLTVIQQGRQVHSLVIKMGSDGSMFVASALIDMYSKCGSIDEACCVFDQTSQKNNICWTSLMTGYAQNGRGLDALQLFENLVTQGYKPDHMCFTAVLTACNHCGFLDKGIYYFNQMKDKYGLVPQIDQYACLIDLHTRNGHLRKAKKLMEEMPYDPNPVMWSSFLSSCKIYGEVKFGKEAADQLFNMETANAAPYATMANIYAEAGIWGKVAEVWGLMKQRGIKKTAGWSWIEVDNRVNIFSAGEASHPQSLKIYAQLEKLDLEVVAGYMNLELLDGDLLE